MVPKLFKKLRLPLNDKMRYVQKLVRLHHRPIALTEEVTDSAIRRLNYDAGDDIDDLLCLCKADITSKNQKRINRFLKRFDEVWRKIQEVEEKDRIRNFQPPIDGEEIMQTFNLEPCREVGLIKDAIKEAILNGEIDNNREEARAYMYKRAYELNLRV
jgi:poly(A) polymerase